MLGSGKPANMAASVILKTLLLCSAILAVLGENPLYQQFKPAMLK
jgi:hypothetical protein